MVNNIENDYMINAFGAVHAVIVECGMLNRNFPVSLFVRELANCCSKSWINTWMLEIFRIWIHFLLLLQWTIVMRYFVVGSLFWLLSSIEMHKSTPCRPIPTKTRHKKHVATLPFHFFNQLPHRISSHIRIALNLNEFSRNFVLN